MTGDAAGKGSAAAAEAGSCGERSRAGEAAEAEGAIRLWWRVA